MRTSLRSVAVLAFACLAARPAGVSADDVEDFLRFDDAPQLEEPGEGPVLLRYVLKTGQVLAMKVTTRMEMAIRQGEARLNTVNTMAFDVKAAVTAVDEAGNMSAVVKITRFQMSVSGAEGEVSFDSDDAEGSPDAFKPLTAMIGVGIPCKMSPVGELLETDLEPLRLAVRRAGNAAFEKELEKSTDKMFEGAFVQLAKEPLKVGETYKAGTIVEDQSKIKMSYKLTSVAGDGQKALLEPIAEIELVADAFPGAEVELKKSRVGGWILHDVARGFSSDSEVRAYMEMEVRAEGETASAELRMTAKMTATLSE
jgi:hypothetical protein